MDRFSSADEVLDFAIKGEIESYEFYTELAEKVDHPWMREVFSEFAREEVGHRKKLEALKEGKILMHAREKIQDLKIADYVIEAEITPDLDYQQALQIAMHKEKKAFRLYSDLARSVKDEGLKNTFLALAQEEAKHKLRFEIEYDDHVLSSGQ